MFPEVSGLAKNDRLSSAGKMGLKEAVALRSVIDAMDAEPAIFGVLADEDEGHDPGKLETALIRRTRLESPPGLRRGGGGNWRRSRPSSPTQRWRWARSSSP